MARILAIYIYIYISGRTSFRKCSKYFYVSKYTPNVIFLYLPRQENATASWRAKVDFVSAELRIENEQENVVRQKLPLRGRSG